MQSPDSHARCVNGGFDLSEATLKAVALRLGIEKNVETMSQMEKAQLRYVQLLETAQRLNLTGDLARTLEAPANQLQNFVCERHTGCPRTR